MGKLSLDFKWDIVSRLEANYTYERKRQEITGAMGTLLCCVERGSS